MAFVARVKLLPEVKRKLDRYAELRGMRPEEVVCEAVERHLREHAEIALRIADARRAHEEHHGRP